MGILAIIINYSVCFMTVFYQRHSHYSHAAFVLKGLLAATLGLAMTACSDASEIAQQSDSVSTVVSNRQVEEQYEIKQALAQVDTEFGEPHEPNQPLDVGIEQLDLTPGMSYGQVRSLVMSEGWVPHTIMNGAAPDTNDMTIKKLNDLGFIEAQACSGTGQGFCRFEFVRIEEPPESRPMLVIVTAPGDRGDEPNFYSWDLENYTPDSDIPIGLEANATYAKQNFSPSLYTEIGEEESYCLATGQCGDVRYLFKDVLMVGSVSDEGFGRQEVALIPHQPVSKSRAISYARMLDTNSAIDFNDSVIEDNNEGELVEPYEITETFFEADIPEEGVASERGAALIVNLRLVPNSNQVSKISFSIVTL